MGIFKKRPYYILVTVSSCPIQRLVIVVIFLRDIGTLLDEQLHHLFVPILGCPVKCRPFAVVPSVDKCCQFAVIPRVGITTDLFLFKEFFHNIPVPSNCGLVKWSPPICICESTFRIRKLYETLYKLPMSKSCGPVQRRSPEFVLSVDIKCGLSPGYRESGCAPFEQRFCYFIWLILNCSKMKLCFSTTLSDNSVCPFQLWHLETCIQSVG